MIHIFNIWDKILLKFSLRFLYMLLYIPLHWKYWPLSWGLSEFLFKAWHSCFSLPRISWHSLPNHLLDFCRCLGLLHLFVKRKTLQLPEFSWFNLSGISVCQVGYETSWSRLETHLAISSYILSDHEGCPQKKDVKIL